MKATHTECAEDGICEAVSNGHLPLRCYYHRDAGSEDEVGDEDIGYRDASDFHQTQRQGS